MRRRTLVGLMVKEARDCVIAADFNDLRAGSSPEFDILVKDVRPGQKVRKAFRPRKRGGG
ncbi:MAG TPA: hypothetical protein VEF34_10580 [Syntrophobacteraceae bacterium]|nr:hypothetical protein [Syntrophobacteraceae bacterium]